MVNILGSFAEFEREMIADRTRRGRRHKVEVRKQFLGSIAPYGFRYVRKDQAAGSEGNLQLAHGEAAVDLVTSTIESSANIPLTSRGHWSPVISNFMTVG